MCGSIIDYTLSIHAEAPVMQIWDYQLPTEHKVIQQYEEGTGLAFSPDSMHITSASSSQVLFWVGINSTRLTQPALLENLSPIQWAGCVHYPFPSSKILLCQCCLF